MSGNVRKCPVRKKTGRPGSGGNGRNPLEIQASAHSRHRRWASKTREKRRVTRSESRIPDEKPPKNRDVQKKAGPPTPGPRIQRPATPIPNAPRSVRLQSDQTHRTVSRRRPTDVHDRRSERTAVALAGRPRPGPPARRRGTLRRPP